MTVAIAWCPRPLRGDTDCPRCPRPHPRAAGGARLAGGERRAAAAHTSPHPPRPAGGSSRCPHAALRTSPRGRSAGGGRAGARPARGARSWGRLGSARSGAERSGKMEGASFGAGRAGGAIDPVDFLKQPQTILRVTTWVRQNGPSRPG